MGWIGGNRYLSQTEQDNNAYLVYDYLSSIGFTHNSICAILGNMVQESTINPNIWEGLVSGDRSRGYGLCQWTPMTKLINYLANLGNPYWDNGYNQLYMLAYDNTQWGNSGNPNAPSVTPPFAWSDFKNSTLDVETLTAYFMYYWEKPSYNEEINRLPYRKNRANYYNNLFGGYTPPAPPTPPTPYPPFKRKKMPLYMMLRRFK